MKSLQPLIDALPSYEKGTGQLRSDTDTYCCLGVAADISGCEWVLRAGRYYIGDDIYEEFLPPSLAEPLGLDESIGNYSEEIVNIALFLKPWDDVGGPTLQSVLATINDETVDWHQVITFLEMIEAERQVKGLVED